MSSRNNAPCSAWLVKYAIEAFVAKAVANSQSICMHDSLCAEVSNRLGRQSDCDMPRTHFPNGLCSIPSFMAEEMPGCLLAMFSHFIHQDTGRVFLLAPSTGTRWDWATRHTSQTG